MYLQCEVLFLQIGTDVQGQQNSFYYNFGNCVRQRSYYMHLKKPERNPNYMLEIIYVF